MLDEDDNVLHVQRYSIEDGHLVEDVDDGSFMWYDDALEKVDQLICRIKELEDRLAEYEIV